MASTKKVSLKKRSPKTKLSIAKSIGKKKMDEWFQKGLSSLKAENEQNRFLRKISVSKYPLMIFNLVIYVIILVYLFQLNSQLCECSSNWKKEFIKYFSFYAILRTIIDTIFFQDIAKNLSSPDIKILLVFDGVLFLSFIIITLTYIAELKKKKCLCSQNWKREFMWILCWVLVGLLGVSYAWVIIVAPIIIGTKLMSSKY